MASSSSDGTGPGQQACGIADLNLRNPADVSPSQPVWGDLWGPSATRSVPNLTLGKSLTVALNSPAVQVTREIGGFACGPSEGLNLMGQVFIGLGEGRKDVQTEE